MHHGSQQSIGVAGGSQGRWQGCAFSWCGRNGACRASGSLAMSWFSLSTQTWSLQPCVCGWEVGGQRPHCLAPFPLHLSRWFSFRRKALSTLNAHGFRGLGPAEVDFTGGRRQSSGLGPADTLSVWYKARPFPYTFLIKDKRQICFPQPVPVSQMESVPVPH